jgi:hypothetical protein
MSDSRRKGDSAVNADEKSSPGLSRRALLLGLFALPVAAILEPEPALAQFGGLFGAMFGGGRYRRRSYRRHSYHGHAHYRGRRSIRRRHRYARPHVLHRHYRPHAVSHHAHGGGHHGGGGGGGGGGPSGPGGGSLH